MGFFLQLLQIGSNWMAWASSTIDGDLGKMNTHSGICGFGVWKLFFL